MTKRSLHAVAACWLAVTAVGCKRGEHQYVPVSGRVVLNGKPLADARVSFQPDAGTALDVGLGSVATTDADGRFSLGVIGRAKGSGAKVGKHRVAVSKSDIPLPTKPEELEVQGTPVPKEILPPRYNATSELTSDVPPGGTSDANFELTTP